MIETPAEILAHYCTRQAAGSFCAWRKRTRKPLTESAALRIVRTLAAITAAGGDASDALGMAEEHGWQTIKADWYFKTIKQETAAPSKPTAVIDRLPAWADFIRSGKDYLCRNIPSSAARELVRLNMVTPEQCRSAGVAL
jgi:hypothetical protein